MSCFDDWYLYHIIYYVAPIGVRAIVVSVSVGLSVCLFVCLSVCLLAYLKPTCPNFTKFFCTWPWLGPPLTAMRYVMYFLFCE